MNEFRVKDLDADLHKHESHSHEHSQTNRILRLLVVSAIIFIIAIVLDGRMAESVVISMYLFATVLSGYTTFLRGLKNLFSLRFNIDTLMTIALVGAISIGEWKEATLVAILFGINELLEGM